MPRSTRQRTIVLALAGALALTYACTDRGVGDRHQPEITPVTARAPIQVDPAHRSTSARYDADFRYDQPVAAPRTEGEEPARRIPAARTKPVPVVLEVSCSVEEMAFDPLPIDQVVSIRVYDDQRRQLAAFSVADDCDASSESRHDFRTDVGAVSTTIRRLRMAAPPALDQRLRDRPADEVTVVGVDAQDRVVLVQTADGLLEAAEGIARGVRIGKAVVWLESHREYAPSTNLLHWRYTTRFVNDEPVALPPEQIIGDASPTAKKPPKAYLAKAPLVLDIDSGIPDYHAQPALVRAVAIHVLGPRYELLATRTVAKDCWYTASTCRLSEEVGTTGYTLEHLRTAFDPALLSGLDPATSPYLSIVAVDAEGRTIVSDIIGAPLVTGRSE